MRLWRLACQLLTAEAEAKYQQKKAAEAKGKILEFEVECHVPLPWATRNWKGGGPSGCEFSV